MFCDAYSAEFVAQKDGATIVYDQDGEYVTRFPEGPWTKQMMILALGLANRGYEMGFERGKIEKAREISKALYLSF